jgi:hypothetical protein
MGGDADNPLSGDFTIKHKCPDAKFITFITTIALYRQYTGCLLARKGQQDLKNILA